MIHFLAVLGILGISFSAIFVKLAGVSPATAAFFRTAYAVPILYLLWLGVRKRDTRKSRQRWLAFGSGLFLGLDFALWHRSIDMIGAGPATVLANTQVVFVGVLGWLIYRERPSLLTLLTVPGVFVGVILLSGLGRPESYGAQPLAGTLLGVASGLAYTFFLVLFRASNRELAPASGPLLDATLGALVGSLFLGLLDGGLELAISWPAHGWLLALALVAQVVGWLLISTAMPRLPALETSVLLLLQPTATVIWGFLLLSEQLGGVQWLGTFIVIAGMGVLLTQDSIVHPAPPDSESPPCGLS